jgi:hypothetical protein
MVHRVFIYERLSQRGGGGGGGGGGRERGGKGGRAKARARERGRESERERERERERSEQCRRPPPPRVYDETGHFRPSFIFFPGACQWPLIHLPSSRLKKLPNRILPNMKKDTGGPEIRERHDTAYRDGSTSAGRHRGRRVALRRGLRAATVTRCPL